jgi:hypothetical protein
MHVSDHLRRTLPLSYAPYRLQAANRWWRELARLADPSRKRAAR